MAVLPRTGPMAVRRAGVLLHVTSLPSPHGPGDLGPAAYDFVDFLASAGCSVWQVLPLVPTHEEERSPYDATSAMAGNPELISLDLLARDGLLTDAELADVAAGRLSRAAARARAAEAWHRRAEVDPELGDDLALWSTAQQAWLPDFVEFTTVRASISPDDGPPLRWPDWDPPLRDRVRAAVDAVMVRCAEQARTVAWEQYVVDEQWRALREYAEERGVLVFGDLPIFVSLDSADVWAHRDLFLLGEDGRPLTVTGVPPDYFAVDGQRWNNPHYDWEAMGRDGFAWWRGRLARQREFFDLVRIDHFRGLEASWHIPVDAETAREGQWVRSPGPAVLAALCQTSGEGTLVAEDLGIITPEVDALREEFGLPGMKILQFAFDGNPENPYLPHRHGELSVVYTGTHDNDTTLGWWRSLDAETRERVLARLDQPDWPMPWALVQQALVSTARLAVVPAQDLLELGSEARMNVPGTARGNWSWQAEDGAFPPGGALARRLRTLVTNAGRTTREEGPERG